MNCLPARPLLLLLLPVLGCAAAPVATIVSPIYLGLPSGATTTATTIDGSGNILLTGYVTTSTSTQVFFARSHDGRPPVFVKLLGVTCNSCGGLIAVDPAGNVYIAGSTQAPDFPTTAGVLGTGLDGATQAGFVIKLNPARDVVYSTLFGGGSHQQTSVQAIAVNSAGEVFVTGVSYGSSFPPGTQSGGDFLMRISASADHAIYTVPLGGTAIALDANDNAYIAGTDGLGTPAFITPGAFQAASTVSVCTGTKAFAFPCLHQYAIKVDPAGNLVFGTFVSGMYSDAPAGIAVDSDGNVYLAGTTGSTDYPATPGAFQTQNRAFPITPGPIASPFYFASALANTPYVTKLSADGSKLLYSTFLGGSITDAGTAMSVDALDQVHLALNLQSPDFPSLPSLDRRCLADLRHYMPALATLSADGSALVSLAIVQGVGPEATPPHLAGTDLIATDSASGLTYVADTTAADPPDAISCITDGADFTAAGPVSPGEVMTIIGNGLAEGDPAVYDWSQQQLPLTLNGTSILVNGVAAPLLYASPTQINFILPYELAGQAQATVQLKAPNGVTAARSLPVVGLTPSLFGGDNFGYTSCGPNAYNVPSALVVNPDGTVNSCDNPAGTDATVYVFLNGAGVNTPGHTGEISASPVPLSAAVTGPGVGTAATAPYIPLGVWTVPVRLPDSSGVIVGQTIPGNSQVDLQVNGIPVRENHIVVWR